MIIPEQQGSTPAPGAADAQAGPRGCPGCASQRGESAGEKNGFALRRCTECGTVFTTRLPAVDGVFDYESYYEPIGFDVPDFIHQRLDEIVAGFEPARRLNRLLDVGFGAGSLLHAARRGGWQAVGVEVSGPAVRHARQSGFEAVHGDLAQAGFPDRSFDMVTAVEVLEHVDEPERLLREVARVLRPGGWFWATTPHGAGLSARLLGTRWSVVAPPEHLQLFSTRGMARLLERAGLQPRRIRTEGLNPMDLWNTLRSSPAVAADAAQARQTTSYALNRQLSTRAYGRAAKLALNRVLDASRLGDSLKVHASRREGA